jgi:subtilisin family serine protease
MPNISSQGLSNVMVAVVDNGVYAHDDLPLHADSFDAHSGLGSSKIYGDHGTAVTGFIGAIANNGKGIAGVASGVKIMPISICYSADATRLEIQPSTSEEFANAIRYAANRGARVINNSWSFSGSLPMSDINGAIAYAQSKGCVVVFSSGNDSGIVAQPQAGAPTSTLVVGAIEPDGSRAYFSNYGSSLDVIAPGTGIWTTTVSNGYYAPSGTSFAAPQISAVAALILAKNPTLTQQQVVGIIERSTGTGKIGGYSYTTTSGRTNGTWNNQMGHGLVDASLALTMTPPSPQAPRVPSLVIEPGYTHPIKVRVGNHISGATYEWDTAGQIVERGADYVLIYIPPTNSSGTARVRAQMVIAGVSSAWSSYLSIVRPYLLPIAKEKEDGGITPSEV